MAGTSESELRALLRDLGVGATTFVGTFDKHFAGFRRLDVPQCAIVNTGSRATGGVHWIAIGFHPARARFLVFDPLGWSDAQLTRLYRFSLQPVLRATFSRLDLPAGACLTITRNTQAVQCSCAGSCGLFCVLFVYCFARQPANALGDALIQRMQGQRAALQQSHWRPLHANQERLYAFLAAHSPYFRAHRKSLMDNTRVGLIKTHAFIDS